MTTNLPIPSPIPEDAPCISDAELQELQRLAFFGGKTDSGEDGSSFECHGCGKFPTRCCCADDAFELLPKLLREVRRLRTRTMP